jgi:hypothetical protein
MLMPIMISMTRFYHNPKLFSRLISVIFRNTATSITAILILLAVTFTSCEEKATIFGSGLLPKTDFLDIISDTTIGVECYTLDSAAIRTSSSTYSYLGRLYDPFFGYTSTDFVAQLRLTKPWQNNGPATVDSVRLYFSIIGAKGTLDSTIRYIRLYEISEDLNTTTKYYSNRSPNLKAPALGAYPMPIITKDTSQSITIVLPNEFGDYLIKRDTTRLTQDDDALDFRKFFKGLYIKLDDAPSPFLIALQFYPANFYISVYYSSPSQKNLVYEFTINDKSVRYNRFSHEFSPLANSTWRQHVINGTKDTMVYLQAFAGVFPQLRIPGLKTYRKIFVDSITKVVHGSVNKARLTISPYLDDAYYTADTIPPQILMRYTQSDTVKYIVPDYQVNPTFFDGTFNTSKKTYSFNIASFVQEYLEGRIKEPVLEMYYPEGEYKNIILKSNTGKPNVKFQFTYTRF